MKITKIPGLGRFGIFVDDVDLNTISNDEWMEIGRMHLESLVTIIRGNDIGYKRYAELMSQWGTPRFNRPIEFYLKYGKPFRELIFSGELNDEEQTTVMNSRRWQIDKNYPAIVRVSPKTNSKGQSIGVFGDGELLWHSNECGDTAFTPGVSLMGWESMNGSCTGFCTSVDWYEEQSESFRSELDDMIVIHNYRPGRVSPIAIPDQEKFYQNNGCPEDNSEVPLVIQSPGGLRGMHLGINTADYILGMKKEDSDKLFERIRKEMFVEKYMYKHWYQSDKDLLIFDNSITLHNRELDKPNAPTRVGLRIQFDYEKIAGNYQPFFQEKYQQKRKNRLDLLVKAMEGMKFP